MNVNFSEKKMFFMPLGGCNEIGLNMNLYCYRGNWIAVDCGCGFAKNEVYGCDITIPNISFILEKKIKLKALIITHSHEDHVGALAHLIDKLKCDVYATEFTCNVIKGKFLEHNKELLKTIRIKKLIPENTIEIGDFLITGYTITHSSPEMQSLHILADDYSIFHTGDWKLDDKPVLEKKTDLKRIKKNICNVNVMVCDSTNVLEKNKSGNEGDLFKSMKNEIKSSKGLTVVTTFASNVSRLQLIYDAAKSCGKKVAISGLSVERALANAEKSEYIENLIINDMKEINNSNRNQYVLICTGCQGEERASLSKMINNEHKFVKLKKDDKVIFSSKIIPGNELSINTVINKLSEKDIEFVTEKMSNIHVSGHPGQEELIQMYKAIKPESLIPVHGDAVRIRAHCNFAKKNRIPESIFIKDGDIVKIELLPKNQTKLNKISSFENVRKNVLDGNRVIQIDSEVIKDRTLIAKNGIFITTLIITESNFELHFNHYGILTAKEFEKVRHDLEKLISNEFSSLTDKDFKNSEEFETKIEKIIKTKIKDSCYRFIKKIPEQKVIIINKIW